MSAKLRDISQRYSKLVESISFAENSLDYSVLDKHVPHLEKLDQISNSAISVYDMFRKTHVFVSPSYRKRLGLPDDHHEGPEGFERLMHPEDLLTVAEAGYYFLKLAMNMEYQRLRHVKLVNEFRIYQNPKHLIRMTEQHQILETDSQGNIWLALSIVDVSPNQNTDEPILSRLVNQETGKITSFHSGDEKAILLPTLTRREKEILNLISKGNLSKQIAQKFSISVHTVNTHRQNIIEKMNVSNTAEAVRLASEAGILKKNLQ